jgi:hypothetical protein
MRKNSSLGAMRQRVQTILNHHRALGHVEPVKQRGNRERGWKLVADTPGDWRMDQPVKRIRINVEKTVMPILESASSMLSTSSLAVPALNALGIEVTEKNVNWIKPRISRCVCRLLQSGKIVSVPRARRNGTVSGWAIPKSDAVESHLESPGNPEPDDQSRKIVS